MDISFFDVNLFMGESIKGTYRPATSAEQLIDEMDNIGIEKALVWHISQYDYSPPEGNKLLSELIAEEERLLGCWTILPPQTKEVIRGEIFFEEMKKNKIFALRAFPDFHRFILRRIAFGKFMDDVVKRKIPLLLSLTRPGITWQGVYDLLAEFPDLVCIICDTGLWGADRYFRTLIENYSNVYLETSFLSLGDGVLEKLVYDYGSKRFIFGSGFPERVPESVMLQIIHADIEDTAKEEIGSGNLERLISEIKL